MDKVDPVTGRLFVAGVRTLILNSARRPTPYIGPAAPRGADVSIRVERNFLSLWGRGEKPAGD